MNEYSLTAGEKSRVLALGYELAKLLPLDRPPALCVVDADCDRLLRRTVQCDLVLVTDYTCMEMYYLHPATVAKFLHVVLGCEDVFAADLLREYSGVLKELFLIRAANDELGLAIQWIPFAASCRREVGGISFDRERFIRHLLDNSQARNSYDALMRKIDELRPRLDGDIRNHSNGHDFLSLLTLDYGKRARKNGLQNAEAISAALRGCVDLERIEEESLFSTLRHKLLENAVE